jgi:hypothetical protein
MRGGNAKLKIKKYCCRARDMKGTVGRPNVYWSPRGGRENKGTNDM